MKLYQKHTIFAQLTTSPELC